MCFSFKYSLSICLFIQSDVNNSSASHHLFLFTYANSLLMTCAFRLNIEYILLVSTYVVCERLSIQSDVNNSSASHHFCLFTYANSFFLELVFVLIFSVYLFIYSKRSKQKQVEPTCFYLLMKMSCCQTWFSF